MIKNKSGRSFVAIMLVIAIMALILRAIISRTIKIEIAQNELNASGTLKLISASLENYAKNNKGVFPATISALVKTEPPYLDKDYTSGPPFKGYVYSCQSLEEKGYSCSATPLKCNQSGRLIYTVTTGGLLVSDECGRKE